MGEYEHYSRGKDDSHKVAIAAIVAIILVFFIHTIIMILAGIGVAAILGGGGYLYLQHRKPQRELPSFKEYREMTENQRKEITDGRIR